MIPTALRDELLRRRGNKSPSWLTRQAQAIVADYGPMPIDDAKLSLAHQAGIRLEKHVSQEAVERIRVLSLSIQTLQVNSTRVLSIDANATKLRRRQASQKPQARRPIHIGRHIKLEEDPLLTAGVLSDVRRMADTVYPILYMFENSVRAFIVRILENAHGLEWWALVVPKGIKEEVAKRKATEERNPFHGRRNAHEIYYTDMKHLENIVRSNWKAFEAFLPDNGQAWFTARMSEMELSRNIVSHYNPLSRDDAQAVEVHYRTWRRQMHAVQDKLES